MAQPSAEITGLGISLPRKSVSSSELDAQHGLPFGTIEAECGVTQRPLVCKTESQISLGQDAAFAALKDADRTPDEIDLLLFAAAVGRQPIPATAPLLKRELGIRRPIPAYDINATCLSALVAMDHASMAIQVGRARRVLVIASEIASSALPWKSAPETAGLFGDGAAALLISDGSTGEGGGYRLGELVMETYPQGYEACQLRAGGTALTPQMDADAFYAGSLFEMNGRHLYKVSSAVAPAFVDRVLKNVGWNRRDVDLVVPHQASPHALAHIIKRCGFSKEQVFDHVRQMGNLVAASLPVALDRARHDGRLEPGARVLLIGTSAGVSLGAMTLEVPMDFGGAED